MEWYCLHTRPKKEAQVVEYCRSILGIETYFPRLREQRIIRRVRRVVVNPLFPRYVFCRMDEAAMYRAVRFAPEVIDIVHSGYRPTAVAPALIAELKSWAGEAVDVVSLQPVLRPGEEVEITHGPLRGIRAVIVRATDDQHRVSILLSILQCGAQMTVPRADLRRVS